MFLREIFTKEFIKEYFHRNKNLIILSIAIFIGSIVLGVVFSESFKAITTELIKQMLDKIPMDTVRGEAVGLFLNNIRANLIILFGGLLFSIMSVFAIIVNGVLIGYIYTLMTPVVFFVGTVPHGIFELTAVMLSLTGAFILTKMELILIHALFTKRFREELENMKVYLKDVVFTVIISTILLIIAAIIEAVITPVLLSMVL